MVLNKFLNIYEKSLNYVNGIIKHFLFLKYLNRLIVFIVILIILFFIVTLILLITKSLEFKEVISALIIALSALLASAVAITNIRQNSINEASNNFSENLADLKFLSFNIVKMIYHLKYLKESINNKKRKHKNEFSDFKEIEQMFRETIMKKEVIIMLKHNVISEIVFDILFTLNVINKYIDIVLDSYFKKDLISDMDISLLGDAITTIDGCINQLEKLNKIVEKTTEMAGKKYDMYVKQGESY